MLQHIAPPLADHLIEDHGIIYSRELVARDERMPERFLATPLAEGPDGVSWHALVTGLETDRAGMRARFETALETANVRQRARFSTALSACYSGLFGFRSAGPARVGFDAWVAGLPIQPDRDRVEPPVGSGEPSETAELMAARGCLLVPFSSETGHVPVGHDLLLYLLAEVEPNLATAEFGEVARFDSDNADVTAPSPYTLQAWSASRGYEAAAHAYNDRYDVVSVIGFLNAVLRNVASGKRYRLLGMDGEPIGYGPHESIRDLDDEN